MKLKQYDVKLTALEMGYIHGLLIKRAGSLSDAISYPEDKVALNLISSIEMALEEARQQFNTEEGIVNIEEITE